MDNLKKFTWSVCFAAFLALFAGLAFGVEDPGPSNFINATTCAVTATPTLCVGRDLTNRYMLYQNQGSATVTLRWGSCSASPSITLASGLFYEKQGGIKNAVCLNTSSGTATFVVQPGR